jgi:RND family efflux transporter MFP subunit
VIAGLLGVCLALAWVCVGCKRPQQADPSAAAAPEATPVVVSTAIQGDIDQTLELTGSADATHQVDVIPEIGGKVIGVYADIGDHVRRGQPLLRIDTQIARANRRVATAGIDSARAKLSQSQTTAGLTDTNTSLNVQVAREQLNSARTQLNRARTSASYMESQVNSQIETARHGVNSAATRLEEAKTGSRRQEIAQANARLSSARSAERYAKINYDRTVELRNGGAVSQSTLDQALNGLEMAQEATREAAEALDLAKEGTRSEEVRLAEIGLQQAQETLSLAEAGKQQIEISRRDVANAEIGVSQAEQNVKLAQSNRGEVELRQRDIENSRAGLDQSAASLDVIDTEISKASVYSPIDGVIASRTVEMGAMLGTGVDSKAFRVMQIDPIYMNAEVSEIDLSKIKIGDVARVTADGLAGEGFLGKVRDIKPQSNEGQRTFVVRISVQNPTARIKAGMFCRAHLVIGKHSNATLISRDCLVEEGNLRQAYVVVDNTVKVRSVKIGAINGTQVEILEGLRPGDILVSTGQKLLADGQAVKPAESSTLDAAPTTTAAEAEQQQPAQTPTPAPK